MSETSAARERMVESQISSRGVADPRVLEAMRTVPREAFVPRDLEEFAYHDTPLPIEEKQTISQPYIVAAMAEALGVEPDDRVLEVGAGSGYAAAVLSRLAAEVYTVERHAELAALGAERLRRLGYGNVQVRHGDGSLGWPEHAPYDAIVVAAAGPGVPRPLLDQLAVGGRLVMPVGSDPMDQTLVRIEKRPTGGHRPSRAPIGPGPGSSARPAARTGVRAAPSPGSWARSPSRSIVSTRSSWARSSSASETAGWCCWARLPTAPRSSIASAPASPASWSSGEASRWWRWRPTGRTRRGSTATCAAGRRCRRPSPPSPASRPGCGATWRWASSSPGSARTT